jgi:hypothetical protein
MIESKVAHIFSEWVFDSLGSVSLPCIQTSTMPNVIVPHKKKSFLAMHNDIRYLSRKGAAPHVFK